MNGKVQGIIICGVIAASLAGVMVFLQKTSKPETEDSSSSQASSSAADESVVILEKTREDIASVYVKNTYGEYTMSKPASGKSTWSIDKLEGVNQNTTAKSSLLDNLSGMEASKLVEENVSDMSKYGLDAPEAAVTVTYSDDSVVTLNIGEQSPDGKSNYVRIDDEGKVYMVKSSKLSYYTDSVNEYAELSLIATPSDDEWPDYGVETISRKDWDYEITFENDPYDVEPLSGQVMTSPIFAYLNITNSVAVTHGMWGLTAESCTVIKPEEDDFKEYGLDDPFCTVSLTGDEYDYLLKIGNSVYQTDSDGNETDTVTGYYCYLTGVSGIDCIYEISADSLPWASFSAEDAISSMMTTNYLVDLSEISVDYEGVKKVYSIESNGTSAETTEDGSAADVTSVTLDGTELDISSFKSFYQYIMTCPTSEIYFTEPTTDCFLTIVQSKKSGGEDTLEFFKDSSRRTIVKLNGQTSFRIQTTWIDTFEKNIDALENGGEIEDNY